MTSRVRRALTRLLAQRRGEPSPLPLEPGIQWPAEPRLTLAGCRHAFDRVPRETLGVEEELLLVSPATYDLAPENATVLAELAGDERFQPELRSSQVEIVTPVCRNAAEVAATLESARRRLVEAAGGRIGVLAAGTHPFATDWGEISDRDRYRRIEDEYSWAARRSLACGLHVHVAVGGADRSLAVFNALRSLLPEITALAANAPFLEGEDTELCTVRPKLFGSLPRTGIPPALESWEEFVGLIDWGRTGGLFPDASFLWWDLRPHPKHGTIELRAADSQTQIDDTAAVAAFVHCLAVSLADRHSAGERLPVHPVERIAENMWRAVRYGVNGTLVDLDTARRETTRDRIIRLVDSLEPTAARLGCRDELAGARALVAGNGADRQRYVAEREGLVGLVSWLVRETESDAETRVRPSVAPAARLQRAPRA
jgi:carboxylate-amine ligase